MRRYTLFPILVAVILSGCDLLFPTYTFVTGESVMLAGTAPVLLRFDTIQSVGQVRSTFDLRDPGCVVYVEGVDYTVDHRTGTMARLPGSSIPDFSNYTFFGKKDFIWITDPNYSCYDYLVFVDYVTRNGSELFATNDQTARLARTRARLDAGGNFQIVWFGDSITYGMDSNPGKSFTSAYDAHLVARFPKASISSRNVSQLSYGTKDVLRDYRENWRILPRGTPVPNLVLVGFGMNDHSILPLGIEPSDFKTNLREIVRLLRERYPASDIVLFSSCMPNYDFFYSSDRMGQFAEATRQVAEETGCAYVDVWNAWLSAMGRKDGRHLLGNYINHPNDFGHWIYRQAFEAMHF